MTQIRNFKDFGIKSDYKGLEGEKINISKVLNKEIEVHRFRIVTSKYPLVGNGKRVDLEILEGGIKRVLFTGSVVLQQLLEKIPADCFPFKTTIVEENDRYEFT